MDHKTLPSENNADSQRLVEILEATSLTVPGAATFFEITPQYLYAILRGEKPLTESLAKIIEEKLGLNTGTVLNLDSPLMGGSDDNLKLKEFKEIYRSLAPRFFQDSTRSKFIQQELLEKDFFTSPKLVKEVRTACKAKGKEYTSDELTKSLLYLTDISKLKVRKEKAILKDGSEGRRLVNVYWTE